MKRYRIIFEQHLLHVAQMVPQWNRALSKILGDIESNIDS